MKTILQFVALVIVIIFSVSLLVAQTTSRDVVYLKNGGVIKGVILEMVPDKTVKIQTSDGSVFVYNMSDVDRITKETAPTGEPIAISTERERSTDIFQGSAFSVFGGVAIPVGDFASESVTNENAGFASAGFTAGIQYVSGGMVGFLVSASYSQNPIGETGIFEDWNGYDLTKTSWTSIVGLIGLKIGTTNPTGPNFFFAPVIGVDFAKSPEFTAKVYDPSYYYDFYSYPYYYYGTVYVSGTGSVAAVSNTAFIYGATAEVDMGHILLGARFISGKPKYDLERKISFSGSNSSVTLTGTESVKITREMSTSIIQIYVGFTF